MVLDAPKWYDMHQNVNLGPIGEDRVRSLRKIPTQLRGTIYCTSSARFAPSFCKANKRSRMHPNNTKGPKTTF